MAKWIAADSTFRAFRIGALLPVDLLCGEQLQNHDLVWLQEHRDCAGLARIALFNSQGRLRSILPNLQSPYLKSISTWSCKERLHSQQLLTGLPPPRAILPKARAIQPKAPSKQSTSSNQSTSSKQSMSSKQSTSSKKSERTSAHADADQPEDGRAAAQPEDGRAGRVNSTCDLAVQRRSDDLPFEESDGR